jgi:hypothetical protein
MVKRIVRRVVKVIAVFAIVAVAGVTVLLTTLWVDHSRPTALPEPSGSCKVGRATYVWTDNARVNPYAPVAGTKQDLAPSRTGALHKNIGISSRVLETCIGTA